MQYFGFFIKINIFELNKNKIGLSISNIELDININFDEIKETITKLCDDVTIEHVEGILNNKIISSTITIILQIKKTLFDKNIIDPQSNYLYYINNKIKDIEINLFNKYKIIILTIAGLIIKQTIYQKYKISFITHIHKVKNIQDLIPHQSIKHSNLKYLTQEQLPIYDSRAKILIEKEIRKAINNKYSISGSLETFIFNCPKGLGDPFFYPFESKLCELLFVTPNLKGIEFADVINVNNNLLIPYKNIKFEDDKLNYNSNCYYGIEEGITSGDTIRFITHYLPPICSKTTESINYKTLENIVIEKNIEFINFYKNIDIIEALCSIIIYDFIKKNR